MFVKICGTTSEEDALLAVAMGADALGFVFAPSSRQVAPALVADIVKRLPPEILTVGVFRDEAPQRVVEVVHKAGLKAAQLHGHETPEQARWIRERVRFVIQGFAAGDKTVANARSYGVDAVLIDSPKPGSGQVFDWTLAEAPSGSRVIVAGGLDEHNVADAIATMRPWGVDVATGVETEPGRKDARKLRAFVANAREAFERFEPEPESDDDEAPLGEQPFDWQDHGG
jgi:phosphoribosylanthranilate isomerase